MPHFIFLLLNPLLKNIYCQSILFSSLLSKISSEYRNNNNIVVKEENDWNIACAKLSLSCQLWTNKWRYPLDIRIPNLKLLQ